MHGGSSSPGAVPRHATLPLCSVEWRGSWAPGLPPEIVVVGADGGDPLSFCMPWGLGAELHETLFQVLNSMVRRLDHSCSSDTFMSSMKSDWTAPIRAALSHARTDALDGAAASAAVQTCVVWEVERACISSSWCRPYLPTESEQKCRWMDSGLQRRHPLLDQHAEWGNAVEPPISMLPIWTPADRWQLVTGEDTDEDAWQYGTSWSSSVWHRRPRPIFDTVRRRQWRRRYKLGSPQDAEWTASAQWARTPPAQAACCGRACDSCCRRCLLCLRPSSGRSPRRTS